MVRVSYLLGMVKNTYSEIMKRKNRVIVTCQDIRGVLNDFNNDILTVEDAEIMLYIAFNEAKSESYKDGWVKTKQIKKK